MEPATADASGSGSTDSDRQVRVDDATMAPSPPTASPPVPPPPPPPGPHDTPQPTTPNSSAWNEVLGGGADGASPPTGVREAASPSAATSVEPPALPTDDAAVARLMEEYEALKVERRALAARLEARQHAEAAESAKIEAELEALAAETVALNREMARREASVYADGPMPPEETRPRPFRRKPSVTSTPWR